MKIVSNACLPTGISGADNGAHYSGIAWPNDQWCRANLTVNGVAGAGAGIALKLRVAAGAQTYYRIAVDHATSNNGQISRFNSGVITSLLNFTQSWNDGDVWEFRVIGSTLYVFYKGLQIQSLVDSSPLVSGSPGLGLSTTVVSASMTNWVAGYFVDSSPGPFTLSPQQRF
jgi:hypothetical protein